MADIYDVVEETLRILKRLDRRSTGNASDLMALKREMEKSQRAPLDTQAIMGQIRSITDTANRSSNSNEQEDQIKFDKILQLLKSQNCVPNSARTDTEDGPEFRQEALSRLRDLAGSLSSMKKELSESSAAASLAQSTGDVAELLHRSDLLLQQHTEHNSRLDENEAVYIKHLEQNFAYLEERLASRAASAQAIDSSLATRLNARMDELAHELCLSMRKHAEDQARAVNHIDEGIENISSRPAGLPDAFAKTSDSLKEHVTSVIGEMRTHMDVVLVPRVMQAFAEQKQGQQALEVDLKQMVDTVQREISAVLVQEMQKMLDSSGARTSAHLDTFLVRMEEVTSGRLAQACEEMKAFQARSADLADLEARCVELKALEGRSSEIYAENRELEARRSAIQAENRRLEALRVEIDAESQRLKAQRDELKAENERLQASRIMKQAESHKLDAILEHKHGEVARYDEAVRRIEQRLRDTQARMASEANEFIHKCHESAARAVEGRSSNHARKRIAPIVTDTSEQRRHVSETVARKPSWKQRMSNVVGKRSSVQNENSAPLADVVNKMDSFMPPRRPMDNVGRRSGSARSFSVNI